ncbi:MAG: hypothetical protein F4X47_02455 [Gammaproteobacteria bacterium]|nr:hypothetical protein [Gammaproteobacteria bacterium]MYC51159.1 hypothetical protein [Gammaproteobacteria bacterium]
MRTFQDESGRTWIATVRERPGHDYKGRYSFVFTPEGQEGKPIELADVRWNSLKTAQRTLATTSGVELRRRLRSARGRASSRGFR